VRRPPTPETDVILKLVPKNSQWLILQEEQTPQTFATHEGALAYAVSYTREAEIHILDESGETVKIIGVKQRDSGRK